MAVCVRIIALVCVLVFTASAIHSKKPRHNKPKTPLPTTTADKLLEKSIRAPSWEFHGIEHQWNWQPKLASKELEGLSLFVRQFKGSYKYAKNELVRMFGAESLVESHLKPLETIAQELDADVNKTVKDIYDVVTWRVTFPTVQQLLQAKSRFINSTLFSVAIVKCFGVCPKSGKYAATGYRGITLLAEVSGKPTEIQLVTPYMVMWADWAYSVLLKSSSKSNKKGVIKYQYKLADYYYELDKLRSARPACPGSLQRNKLDKKSLMFDSLGGPPSSCQFWNDLDVNKNKNIGERRTVLAAADQLTTHGDDGKKKGLNKPSVIDVDKILKPKDLKEKTEKRSTIYPKYLYY